MFTRLSRRDFLKMAALSGTSALLAACSQDIVVTPIISGGGQAGSASTQTPATDSSSGPIGAVPPPADADKLGIKLLVRGGRGIISQSIADSWNANSKAQLTLDNGTSGFTTTADVATMMQTNIASGNQPWDGYATISSPYDLTDFVKKEVIVPLDALIQGSLTPGAGLVLSSILPSIKPAISYEGKVYGIPATLNSTAFVYYPQTLKDSGYNDVIQTYDDVHTASLLVRKKFPTMIPFFSTSSPLTDLWTWLWAASPKPLDADGMIDIRSPEAIGALTWLRGMLDDGLSFGLQGGVGYGGSGRRSSPMMVTQDSFPYASQPINTQDATLPQGKLSINYSLVPKTGVPNAGVPFWVNLCTVFNKAKNPQGLVNFYLWLFGPDNKDVGKLIALNSPKPCYTYTYTEFVQTNPDLAWEKVGADLTAKSTWFPMNTSHTIEQNMVRTHIQVLLDPQKQYSPDLAKSEMQAAYSEIQKALGKG